MAEPKSDDLGRRIGSEPAEGRPLDPRTGRDANRDQRDDRKSVPDRDPRPEGQGQPQAPAGSGGGRSESSAAQGSDDAPSARESASSGPTGVDLNRRLDEAIDAILPASDPPVRARPGEPSFVPPADR